MVSRSQVNQYREPARRLDTGAGQLPEAFEMDERSHAAASDEVLQLVSGRQLLGAVRVRRDVHLPIVSPGMQPLPRHLDRALPATREGGQPGGEGVWGGKQGGRAVGGTGDVSEEEVNGAVSEEEGVGDPGRTLRSGLRDARHGAPGDSTEGVSSTTRSGHSTVRPASARDWAQGPALELLVRGEIKAVAMQRLRRNGRPLTEVYSAGGDLVAREAGGYIQLVGRGGGTQHSVVRGTTPLVRHLQFMFQPMGAR